MVIWRYIQVDILEKTHLAVEYLVRDFHSKKHLKTHMVTHHRWKCFICQKCGTGYVQWSDLKIHIQKHIGEKYRIRLLQNIQLKCRTQKYIEGKPYICKDCGTGFVISGNMKQHISIHTWEWTFSCKECDSGFLQESHLKTHMAQAFKVTSFKIHWCQTHPLLQRNRAVMWRLS